MSADICLYCRIGNSLFHDAQKGIISLRDSKRIVINSCIMYYGITSKCHVPSIQICIITVLGQLTIVKINNGSSAFRNKKITVILYTTCPKEGKRCYRINRVFILSFQFCKRYLHNKIFALQTINHIHIKDRFIGTLFRIIQFFICFIIRIGITGLFKILFHFLFQAVICTIAQNIKDFCFQ